MNQALHLADSERIITAIDNGKLLRGHYTYIDYDALEIEIDIPHSEITGGEFHPLSFIPVSEWYIIRGRLQPTAKRSATTSLRELAHACEVFETCRNQVEMYFEQAIVDTLAMYPGARREDVFDKHWTRSVALVRALIDRFSYSLYFSLSVIVARSTLTQLLWKYFRVRAVYHDEYLCRIMRDRHPIVKRHLEEKHGLDGRR